MKTTEVGIVAADGETRWEDGGGVVHVMRWVFDVGPRDKRRPGGWRAVCGANDERFPDRPEAAGQVTCLACLGIMPTLPR